MGFDKPLARVGGVTLVERVARVVTSCAERVVIVTNAPESYAFLGTETIPDVHRGCGPLGGMSAAFAHLPGPSVLVVAADYPFLEAAALDTILSIDPCAIAGRPGAGEAGVVLPRIGGRLHPLCAHYAVSLRPEIERAIAERRLAVRDLVSRVPLTIFGEAELGLEGAEQAERVFWNANTPEDLRQAEVMLGEAQSRG